MAGEDPTWEHCQLLLLGVEGKGDRSRYHLGIRYFGTGSRMLSILKGDGARDWGFNPWEKAIGELGRSGWELVTVQHANVTGDMGGGGEIGHNQVVAYFKRVAVAGRDVDDPPLDLERE